MFFMTIFSGNVLAETGGYNLLAPLPYVGGSNSSGPAESTPSPEVYLKGIIQLLIAVAGVLAVIMITIGGIQYMTTDVVDYKTQAKDKIQSAIYGLILAIVSWLILYTINPELVSIKLLK